MNAESRNHTLTFHWQVEYDYASNEQLGSQFETNASVQIISSEVARASASTQNFVVPPSYTGQVVIISRDFLSNFLHNTILTFIRSIQSVIIN